MLNLIKQFTSAFSVTGWERPLAELIQKTLAPVADESFIDPLGNLLVLRKGKDSSRKLMIASHMDEIGFVVTSVDDGGFVHVSNVGGINAVASAFHRVRFRNGGENFLDLLRQRFFPTGDRKGGGELFDER